MTTFGFWDRLHPYVTFGTLTTARQRRERLIAAMKVGRVPTWVRLACEAKLPVMRVGGVAR